MIELSGIRGYNWSSKLGTNKMKLLLSFCIVIDKKTM